MSTLAPAASQARCAVVGRGVGGDDERGRELGVEQRALGGDAAGGVEEDAAAAAVVHRAVGVAHGEAGTVGERGARADDDGLRLGPEAVGVGARRGAGDPLRRAVAGGDATVEAHGRLHHREGAPEPAVHEVRRERAGGGVGADADVDGDAEVAQLGDALPGDLRVGILERDHDPGDAGLGQRDHAGSGAALVRAGLERGVDGGAAGPVAGLAQGLDLGVRTAGRLRGALADDLAVAHDDRADPRIGRGPPAGGLAPGQRPVHELGVGGHLSCCSVSPGRLGLEPCRRGRSDDGPAAHLARLRCRSWSAPSPIRTLTVGPGF